MAKDPAFLFYSQDFIVGVQTMDFEDRGKYITILAQMHQQGRMNEKTIRFLVGNVSDNLKLKFAIDKNGLWYNKRLEEETIKRKSFTESRRINGSKGGRPKKEEKASGLHMVNHMEDVNVNENDIKNIPSYIDFEKHALSKDKNLDLKALKNKYDSWIENDWKDGNNKKILNWKSKLTNTITYIPKLKNNDSNAFA